MAAEGRHFSTAARIFGVLSFRPIFAPFFGLGKSTHMAAEGGTFLKLTEPGLQAATQN